MDSIFKKGLINEIIWKRQTAHSDVKQGAKHLGRLHDVILLYSKGKPRAWNMEYTQYDTSYIENFYKFIESDTGRRYRLSDLTAAKPGGDTRYSWKGVVPHVGRYWAYSKENMEEFERQGRLVYPKKRGGVPQYKRYLDEMLGVPLQDVWTDILPVQSRQRRGPTQKPMSLLERIIKLSSNPTDIVLDPMCGYGTTIIAAHKLGRRWIGIDISPTSCKFMAKEIQKVGARDVEIIGLPKTVEEIKKMQPFEFQNWIMEKLIAHPSKVKVGDMGVDGRLINGTPIQVKHSENVGRNVVDNFETAIKRERKTKGIIVALSFGKGAYEEAARIKNQGELDIRLMTIEDIIREE
jgi:adenine-specific DNA-methyltransferase